MKEIKLTKGYKAIVDDEDFEWLSQWKWYATRRNHGRVYAIRHESKRNVYMHREILACKLGRPLLPFPEEQADHIVGIGLDNRRDNLRVADNSQNQCNGQRRRNNTSGFKGVHWCKRDRKWIAQIAIKGKHLQLGGFDDPLEAAHAYDQAAWKYHGEFAKTNF